MLIWLIFIFQVQVKSQIFNVISECIWKKLWGDSTHEYLITYQAHFNIIYLLFCIAWTWYLLSGNQMCIRKTFKFHNLPDLVNKNSHDSLMNRETHTSETSNTVFKRATPSMFVWRINRVQVAPVRISHDFRVHTDTLYQKQVWYRSGEVLLESHDLFAEPQSLWCPAAGAGLLISAATKTFWLAAWLRPLYKLLLLLELTLKPRLHRVICYICE